MLQRNLIRIPRFNHRIVHLLLLNHLICSHNTFLGSNAPILALIAFPSKTNSLISFPVPGLSRMEVSVTACENKKVQRDNPGTQMSRKRF